LQHLETDAQPLYTRAEVATLFQIGSSRAADLMHIAGAEIRNGRAATVSRTNLRFYIERCPEARAFLSEEERKRKLAKRLRQTAEDLRQKSVGILDAKPADEWTRWQDLPNVALEPGMMRIMFLDQQALLHTLWLISRAMANEPDVFLEMCAAEDRPGVAR
jgi:hypothetical protein